MKYAALSGVLLMCVPAWAERDQPLQEGGVMAYSETLARPLFTASRRPYSPPETPVLDTPAPEPTLVSAAPVETAPVSRINLSQMRLRGVLEKAGHRIALVEHRETGQTYRLTLGLAPMPGIDGEDVEVEVTAIEREAITLNAGTPLTLALRETPDSAAIDVQKGAADGVQWATLEQPVDVAPLTQATIVPAKLVPVGVARNTGFTVGRVDTE
ncbi:hypothetical protein [uncultured Roseobacter sp.]|uniref:hypothetical protein n=1 Tax=uncultured Roseobacter sp. TaxID=114847 RepID=UPI00263839A1|nr:hypothetical protein [uncultured Roseobacter sp.]